MPSVVRWIETGRLAPRTVLEVGCGGASNALWLASRGVAATAIDFSPQAIRFADRRARRMQLNLTTRVVDVRRGDDTLGKFDLVIDSECVQDMKTRAEREEYAKSVSTWLAPGGALLIASWLFRTPAEEKTRFPISRLPEYEIPSLFPRLRVDARLVQERTAYRKPGCYGVFLLRDG